MKAFIISLSKIESSITTANNMIQPLSNMGFDVELFEGTYGPDAVLLAKEEGRILHPTDHDGKPMIDTIRVSGPGALGCFYSHYRLWQKCVELNQPIFIFEDDVKFIREYIPVHFDEILILVLGSWKEIYDQDIYIEPTINHCAQDFPGACVPGTPGYAITPIAATKLLKEFDKTYTASDAAIRKSVVDIKIYSHIIGEAITDKVSLTHTDKFWRKYNK
jgi:GR25 family glycosyltransferase involved in LPS biosynthesis